MLPEKFSLHGIEDVEAFCGNIARRANLELCRADAEDLHAYLIETCWELSTIYKPGGPKDFDGWAGRILALRVTDWQRSRFGRTRYVFATRPEWNQERTPPSFTELGPADTELTVDLAPDRSPDLVGVLTSGGSAEPGCVDALGGTQPRVAA